MNEDQTTPTKIAKIDELTKVLDAAMSDLVVAERKRAEALEAIHRANKVFEAAEEARSSAGAAFVDARKQLTDFCKQAVR